VFAGTLERERAALAATARDHVLIECDPADWFCLMRSGRVKFQLRVSRSGKEVVLELLGPGDPFGGVAVIERCPYPASAQTTEDSVVLKIPREPILALAERHPGLIREMALMTAAGSGLLTSPCARWPRTPSRRGWR